MNAEKGRKIAVIGSGRMGPGIAQLAAIKGYEVTLWGRRENSLKKAEEKIIWSTKKLVKKKILREDAVKQVLNRINYEINLRKAVCDADLIIEAIIEDTEIKTKMLSQMARDVPSHTIISSTTSTIPISELADAAHRPEKFIGIHFFNPPQLIELVEIIPGKKTSQETLQEAINFATSLGKQILLCKRDVPAFIVNRVLLPILDEAAWIVFRGESTITSIDSTFKERLKAPMGPFELMDFIGIDVVYHAMREVIKRERTLIAFCPLIKKFYENGFMGRDRGGGFYQHPDLIEKSTKNINDSADIASLLAPAANSIARILKMGLISIEEIDRAVKAALKFSTGIIHELRSIGFHRIRESLLKKYKSYNYESYLPEENLIEIFYQGEKHGK